MSRRFLFTLATCCLTFGADSVPTAAKPVAARRPREALRVPIPRLIRDLEHRDYATRVRATNGLIAHGGSAVPALTKAAQSAGPETAARAVLVLERLYTNLNADEKTVDAAETALETLQESHAPVAARMSSQALTGHEGLRQRRAIAAIQRLGGIVEYVPTQYRQPNPFPQPAGAGRQINFVLIGRKWRGGDDGLKYVKRLTQLRNVYVTQNERFQPVSKKALEKLERSMPNLSIQKRGMACLGVSGSMNGGPGGCYITLVKPGSAASKANIRAGDTIVEFAGKRIRDFQTLVDGISGHDAGDTVDVGILRSGRKITVKVKLAEWKK
ncbi:MAG: PDZ domain-containing protein [Planctomycetaceae bacterium]